MSSWDGRDAPSTAVTWAGCPLGRVARPDGAPGGRMDQAPVRDLGACEFCLHPAPHRDDCGAGQSECSEPREDGQIDHANPILTEQVEEGLPPRVESQRTESVVERLTRQSSVLPRRSQRDGPRRAAFPDKNVETVSHVAPGRWGRGESGRGRRRLWLCQCFGLLVRGPIGSNGGGATPRQETPRQRRTRNRAAAGTRSSASCQRPSCIEHPSRPFDAALIL